MKFGIIFVLFIFIIAYYLLPTTYYLFTKSNLEYKYNKASVYQISPPKIYYGMGAISGDYAFMSLPVGWSNGKYKYGYPDAYPIQFLQTVHGKKIIAGNVDGVSKETIDYYRQFSIIQFFLDPLANENLIANYSAKDLKSALDRLGISYILVHKDSYDEEALNKLKFYLEKTDFGSPFFEDEKFKVYSFIQRIKEET